MTKDTVPMPKRAFELNLKIGSNDWLELVRHLHEIAHHIEEHGPDCNSIMGGATCSHIVDIHQDPLMTHDKYMEHLQAYIDSREQLPEDSNANTAT